MITKCPHAIQSIKQHHLCMHNYNIWPSISNELDYDECESFAIQCS